MCTAPGTWPATHSCSSRASTTVIGSALRTHCAMSSTSTVSNVDTDPQQLALRLAELAVGAAHQDDGPSARDEPAHPCADRALDAHEVAARDVAAVVITACAHVDDGGAVIDHPPHLVRREPCER